MNDRSKLVDVIESYLDSDVEMDFMAAFSSLITSEDSSVRCVSESLYYLSSQEYPDFRREMAVRSFVEEVKRNLINGEVIDKSSISACIQSNLEMQNLLNRAGHESMANGWLVVAIVVTLAAFTVYLVVRI